MANKRVLILCTGNSCRSIMAEALINAKLDNVEAKSSGVRAQGSVNPKAKALLEKEGLWRSDYHSKSLDSLLNEEFDLVVTVCDNAKESCPIFPKDTKVIHIGFIDPSGKDDIAYRETLKKMEEVLLPAIKRELNG